MTKEILHIYLLSLAIWMIASISVKGQIIQFDFDEASGSTSTQELISGENFQINNNFGRPERVNGVVDKALRLDGWSTFINQGNIDLSGIDRQMTIETWYTTEAFNAEESAIIDLMNGDSGFHLSIGPYGEIVFAYHIDNSIFRHSTTKRISPYEWHHIVTTVNLDNSTSRIYVDGELWFIDEALQGNSITLENSSLFIGKRNLDQQANGFPINVLNGAIDEIKIFDSALQESEIIHRYEQIGNRTANLGIDPRVRHAGDHLRPQYHPMPNTHWANEAYGLTYYNGNYHLFFQKNPNAPQLYYMHWGHLISPDLVHWREEKIALRPTRGFDNFGTWSGTTIKNQNDIPEIFYTGVNGIIAGIGGAFTEDDSLINWQEYEENPVISRPPENYNHLDFRDPYVWKRNGTYYMIIGSGLQNDGGGILFTYRSEDLVNWTEIDPLYTNNDVAMFGQFWEMPTFSRLNEEVYLLQITPTPQPDFPARSIYLLGEWKEEKFFPYFETPKSIELFDHHLLAPAFGVDEETSNTYIGIIPEDRNVQDQINAGWRQTFSLPRQVRLLNDSSIGQIPHPNLCRLRSNEQTYNNLQLESGQIDNLPDFGGNQIELEFEIKGDSNAIFDIVILKHEDDREKTRIGFNYPENTIELDRTNSTLSVAKKDLRSGEFVFNPQDTLHVRIFIDHSTLEVFIQNLTVFSARVYPSRETSDQIDIILNNGQAQVLKATQWQMDSIIENTIDDITCLPDYLPDAFNRAPVDRILGVLPGLQLKVYPNPCFYTSMTVEVDLPSNYCIRNLLGMVVQQGTVKKGVNNLAVEHIDPGIYLFELYNSEQKKSQKIILNQIK